MLGKITLYNGVVYKIGDRTQDTSDGLYSGRIMEELQLESRMSESGNAPITMNITIRNDDNFIPNTTDLWAAIIELTSNSGGKWTGKINFFDFDADGNLYITASEKAAPELELQLPDEVRQVYTVDEDFHPTATSMTIPLVIGGSSSSPLTLSTILIDKTEGVYLICVGEIRSILKVYNGSEELPASAYTAYTGTALQSEHPGFAYVKINEDYRKNSDGSYAEINVDVIGLVLGLYTAEECRNPARFLYYFLTTPATGVNGWGCGISASDIDWASFNTAITLCDTLGYKLDGIMWLRQSAQSWIDQICQTMHASYTIGANGKRTLFVDYAGAASKRTFTENDCKVSRYGKNSYTGSVYNKGVLSYGYNPITGLFMQSAQFEDATSVAQIGEQKFTGESYLINDAATALKVLEYTCKRSLTSAEAIEFETDRLETVLKAGDLITLDFPSRNISGDYQIASITASEYKSSISAVKFDTSVFTVTGSQSNVAWGDDRDITPALTPAQATNLLLSTGFDINPDGSGIPYISGTFDVPEGGWIAAAVQYGTGAVPTNWTELALITEGRFKIQPVSVGTAYTIRIRMITATGHSSYITGQITSTGDTVAPGTPTLALSATEKNVIVKCALDNPPYDMGGFQVWRKKHTDEVFTLVGTVAANFGYASFADHVETFVQYDYKIKSYDRSGNLSDFSDVVSITPTGLEATELAATALKIPTGSILNINAKGSTTESIKTANGVIDGSGFGHHGQAYGGVSIIDGGEGFSFDGSSGYVSFPTSLRILYGLTAHTITARIKTFGTTNVTQYVTIFNDGFNRATIECFNLVLSAGGRNASSDPIALNSFQIEANKEYFVALVMDYSDGKTYLYVDGELKGTKNLGSSGSTVGNLSWLTVGSYGTSGQHWNGTIKDFRIYPRALSAVEVKSLFMIPQEVVLSRVTADVIGANAVNAIHLNAGSVTANAVGTNEIISNTANIRDGVISNAKIANLDAAKIISGIIAAARIGAGSISAEKLSIASIKAPTGCQWHITANGIPSANNNNVIGSIGSVNGRSMTVTGGNITIEWHDTYGKRFRLANNTNAIGMVATPGHGMTAAHTVSVWIQPTEANSGTILVNMVPSSGSAEMSIMIQNGSFDYITNDGTTWTALGSSANKIPVNQWTHIAVVSTGSVKKIYVNGVLDKSQTQSVVYLLVAKFGYMNFATPRAGRGFIGYTNDFRWYNRALSDEEIMTLYKLGTDTESGQITADRVATDAIRGRTAAGGGDNSYTTSGLKIGLDGGGWISGQKFKIASNGAVACTDLTVTGGLLNGISIPAIITAVETNFQELTLSYTGITSITFDSQTGLPSRYTYGTFTRRYTYGYIKFSNGFIIQFGASRLRPTDAANIDVALPKRMSNSYYTVIISGSEDHADGDFTVSSAGNTVTYTPYMKTETSFRMYNGSDTDSVFQWVVFGKA